METEAEATNRAVQLARVAGCHLYVAHVSCSHDGSSVGALSVADRMPRSISERQLKSLESLARQISRELRLRRDLERASTRPPPDFPVGPGMTVGDRWRIARRLGRGAVGAVF
jgi:hypothetical protein